MKTIKTSAKQLGRSVDMTAEAYDRYFTEYPSDSGRTVYRIEKAIELTGNSRGRALSVGVGNFGEADHIKKAGFDIEICDLSPKAVAKAYEKGYAAFVADISEPLERCGYDFIFCMEVLEHVTNPLKALKNLADVLSPSGQMIISLPNEFNLYRRLAILIGRPGIGGHEYHHLRFFDIKSARTLIENAGLKIAGLKYTPLIPPRWRLLHPLGELLKTVRPQLFALSSIWLLKKPENE